MIGDLVSLVRLGDGAGDAHVLTASATLPAPVDRTVDCTFAVCLLWAGDCGDFTSTLETPTTFALFSTGASVILEGPVELHENNN